MTGQQRTIGAAHQFLAWSSGPTLLTDDVMAASVVCGLWLLWAGILALVVLAGPGDRDAVADPHPAAVTGAGLDRRPGR